MSVVNVFEVLKITTINSGDNTRNSIQWLSRDFMCEITNSGKVWLHVYAAGICFVWTVVDNIYTRNNWSNLDTAKRCG
jgi:hypothetical protein